MKTEFNRITVKAQLWWGKPLNGTNGKKSFLMRGGETPYRFKGRVSVQVGKLVRFLIENEKKILENIEEIRAKAAEKEQTEKIYVAVIKEETGVARMIKGIRGAIRHRIMNILHQKNISYCSPTTKKEFQTTKEPTLLEGEHLMAECGEEPCPIRQLFGTMFEESTIRVWSDSIIETDKTQEQIIKQKGLAFAYVSMEERHSARRDNKTLQNFLEQYLMGEFQFYVEFSKELPDWLLGLLLEGILAVEGLGNGKSAGYGRLEIRDIAYEQITFERKLGEETNGRIAIIEEEQTISLNNKLQESRNAWNNYN